MSYPVANYTKTSCIHLTHLNSSEKLCNPSLVGCRTYVVNECTNCIDAVNEVLTGSNNSGMAE